MPKRTFTIASIVIAITALPAVAAPSDRGGPESRFPINISEAQARVEERFAAMDTDGDNTISLSEFEAAKGLKQHADKPMKRRHRAHKRSDARHPQHRGRHSERVEAHREAVKGEVFAILDSNNDGNISAEEHAAADGREVHKLARKRAMFKRLDVDADGLLQLSEMPDPASRLRAADSDGDGLVTRQEMRSHRTEKRAARANESG